MVGPLNIIIEKDPIVLVENITAFKPFEVDSKWVDELKVM